MDREREFGRSGRQCQGLSCDLSPKGIRPPMLVRYPWEHLTGSRIPKGKMKAFQNSAQDKGYTGKSDSEASHHIFPQ